MKKIAKYFSIILFSAFFMFIVVNNPVSANYDREKNQVAISISKDEIVITVKYQRGFDKVNATYKWCAVEEGSTIETIGGCPGGSENTKIKYVEVGGNYNLNYIAMGESNYVDNNLTTYTFTIPKDKDYILSNINGAEANYVIFVETIFCTVRNSNGDNTSYDSCSYYDPEVNYAKAEVNIESLVNDNRVIIGDIEDEGLNNMVNTISSIVYDTVLPIIWAVVGLFLVVKGSILGVQIVKAADEPQVRQEKLGSLKWLVIGVAIAALAAGAVQIVTGYFKGVFN